MQCGVWSISHLICRPRRDLDTLGLQIPSKNGSGDLSWLSLDLVSWVWKRSCLGQSVCNPFEECSCRCPGTKADPEMNKGLGNKAHLSFMVRIFSDFIQGSHDEQNPQCLLSCVWIRCTKDVYGNRGWSSQPHLYMHTPKAHSKPTVEALLL